MSSKSKHRPSLDPKEVTQICQRFPPTLPYVTLSVPFPPAKPIFIALAVLLGTARNVGASHDAVANLLELIEQLVDRIESLAW